MNNSEFAEIAFCKEDNVLVLSWKKYCCGDTYRDILTEMLNQLKTHTGSSLIVDFRNGFEELQSDLDWVYDEFIPLLSRTAECDAIAFIVNKEDDRINDLNIWCMVLEEYFCVEKFSEYNEAVDFVRKARF